MFACGIKIVVGFGFVFGSGSGFVFVSTAPSWVEFSSVLVGLSFDVLLCWQHKHISYRYFTIYVLCLSIYMAYLKSQPIEACASPSPTLVPDFPRPFVGLSKCYVGWKFRHLIVLIYANLLCILKIVYCQHSWFPMSRCFNYVVGCCRQNLVVNSI